MISPKMVKFIAIAVLFLALLSELNMTFLKNEDIKNILNISILGGVFFTFFLALFMTLPENTEGD